MDMLSLDEEAFVAAFNILAKDAHETAVTKGWWKERKRLINVASAHDPALGAFAEKAIAGMMVALEHSELSEGLEGLRKDLSDDKIPEFTMEEAEAADTIIRIMDRAVARNLRVGWAIIAKMRMNKGRPHLHGGKSF
jgi:KaiC/GvpD/RAD55 family RecA-like ATPase